jgi:dihydroorotase
VAAVLEGLADGAIDCIATDHAPHAPQEKDCEFDRAMFGLVGLETVAPLSLDRLVRPGIVPLAEVIAKLTTHPARVLLGDGVNPPPGVDPLLGTLQQGAPGDVTVLDLDRTMKVEAAKLYSRSKNTPFEGWELTGVPVATVVGGKVIMQDGVVAE